MSAAINPADYRLNDEQKQIRASVVAMFAVAAVFVALRCFVRIRLQAQFSTDDWLLLVALAGYLATTIIIVLCIDEGGFGRKTDELSVETFYTGAKFLVLSQLAYIQTIMLTKLSIALLQLRIIGLISLALRRVTFVSMAVNVIIATYEFFALLFQCIPPAKYWTPTMTRGHCADRTGVAIGVYVYSAVNVVLDWYYALALAPMVWKLQMRKTVKISTVFVLGMGVSASVANITRFQSLIGYATQKDVLYIFIPILIRTWVELCLGFAAASMTTFQPLVRVLPWAHSSSGSSDPSPFTTWRSWRAPKQRRDPMELSDLATTNMTVQADERGGGENRFNSMGDAESQVGILTEPEPVLRADRGRP